MNKCGRGVLLPFLVLAGVAAVAQVQPGAATSGSGGINRPEHARKLSVVLVSFDGFAALYLDRFSLPNFERLMQRGVRAKSLQPVFPTLTFPSHYSLVTGLHPEQHGIVGMSFIDPARGQTYSIDDDTSRDGSWYRGEPIWVTAEKQGMVAATFFWPGSEAAIQNVRPTYWKKYDGSVPDRERVQAVLNWLQLPAEKRPHVLTVYFSEVDGVGHRFGPESEQMVAAVQRADQTLGLLLDGIDALSIRDQVAVVVVSDHGMAKVTKEQTVPVDSLLDVTELKGVGAGSQMSLYATPQLPADKIRDTLNAKLHHGRAYLREELPERFHYRADPRVGDVVIVMEEPWRILPPKGGTRDMTILGGWHGWDPSSTTMHGIFLAMGPGIQKQTLIGSIEAVQIYPFLTELLGLKSASGVMAPPSWVGQVLKR